MLSCINPLSLIDYFYEPSIVIFFSHCNLDCEFCLNKDTRDIVDHSLTEKRAKEEINNAARTKLVNAVVFSGGECTLQPDLLGELCSYAKSCNLKTAIQTNGYDLALIKKLTLDQCQIDIKDPSTFDFSKLRKICEHTNLFLTYVVHKKKNYMEDIKVLIKNWRICKKIILIEGKVPDEYKVSILPLLNLLSNPPPNLIFRC